MSVAMNGKNFESQLRAASVKLQRAVSEEFDPRSGFSTDAIVDFLIELPDLGNDEQIAKAQAVLRRNGFADKADELGF